MPRGTFEMNQDDEASKEFKGSPDEVKVVVYENGDSTKGSKAEIIDQSEVDTGPYAGMGKDLVLKYSDTPFFNRLRKALLAIFLIVWLGLLAGVIYLAASHKSCRAQPKVEWWQTAQAYRVYVRSFQDTDGDGVGDLLGVQNRLDYLKDIGIDAIWLSAFYKSPMEDLGNDVEDHTMVDPLFGNMITFDGLLRSIHDKGMKLIVDFIPNHTSDKHPWFRANKTFYMYKADCQQNKLPNNWISVYGGSMWSFDDSGSNNGCYLHQFYKQEPDLNFRNNRVKEQVNEIARFWLAKGVDGFRVDSAAHLYEDYMLDDEPEDMTAGVANTSSYDHWNHTYTFNMPEVMDMITSWRGIMNGYEPYRFMAVEVNAQPKSLQMYYGRQGADGADFPYNFQLVSKINRTCNGECVWQLINGWLQAVPTTRTANWALGNENTPRLASKVGDGSVDAMTMLALLLPGASITYYGDEIGMTDLPSSSVPQPNKDRAGRDAHRSPMQWTSSSKSGFCTYNNCTDTWLPLHPNSSTVNVEAQLKLMTSHLHVYKNVSALRKSRTFQVGEMARHNHADQCIVAFRRFFDGLPTYLVTINFCEVPKTIDLTNEYTPNDSRYPITVAAKTGGVPDEKYQLRKSADLSAVTLDGYQGLVFTWGYVIDEII